MQQYQELIQTVLDTGSWQDNRTGIRTLSVPGAMMRFDLLNDGFPAVTTKRLAFKSVVGELPRAGLQSLGPERQRKQTMAGQSVSPR
jgi:thymidylate synthase